MKEMTCYNIVSSRVGNQLPSGCNVLSAQLAVPSRPGHTAARSHCAINLLGISSSFVYLLELCVDDDGSD